MRKVLVLAAAAVAGLATAASADMRELILESAVEGLAEGLVGSAAAQAGRGAPAPDLDDYPPGTVVVSCYRGPWRETIWDHPTNAFVDSLRAVGYDFANAEAIGDRICRDETLVGDEAALRAEVERLIAESPASRRS